LDTFWYNFNENAKILLYLIFSMPNYLIGKKIMII
jgi:hypothetical protein